MWVDNIGNQTTHGGSPQIISPQMILHKSLESVPGCRKDDFQVSRFSWICAKFDKKDRKKSQGENGIFCLSLQFAKASNYSQEGAIDLPKSKTKSIFSK